jgi:hypothetical protein
MNTLAVMGGTNRRGQHAIELHRRTLHGIYKGQNI